MIIHLQIKDVMRHGRSKTVSQLVQIHRENRYPSDREHFLTDCMFFSWQEHTVKCTVQISTQNTGFESSCSHLNFRFRACFEEGVPWHSGNYWVWIHSETRTWHDKNIQSKCPISTWFIWSNMSFCDSSLLSRRKECSFQSAVISKMVRSI